MLQEVYIINLPKDVERRRDIETNFRQYGVKDYIIFPAIYTKELSKEEVVANTTLMCRSFLCPQGVVGSGMSHAKIWEIVSKKKDGWYMICEDDVNFTPNTWDHLRRIFHELQGRENEPIMISLKSCSAYHYQDTNRILVLNKFVCGISAYLITPTAARHMYEYIARSKLNQYIDIQLGFCNCGLLHYTTPFPILKDSDLGGYDNSNNMTFKYSVPLLQFLIHVLVSYNWSEVINFRLNIPIVCFMMKACVTIGQVGIVMAEILNLVWWRQEWLHGYVLIEALLVAMFVIKKRMSG